MGLVCGGLRSAESIEPVRSSDFKVQGLLLELAFPEKLMKRGFGDFLCRSGRFCAATCISFCSNR